MALRIRTTKETEVDIYLERQLNGVDLWIDGELIANIMDTGEILVHSKTEANKYNGRWDK